MHVSIAIDTYFNNSCNEIIAMTITYVTKYELGCRLNYSNCEN